MDKSQTRSTFLSLGIAMILVVCVAYQIGAKHADSGKKSKATRSLLSPAQIAEGESKGLMAYFHLTQGEQVQIYQLYKAYEEVSLPFTQKMKSLSQKGIKIDEQERAQYRLNIDKQRTNLVAGMETILSPLQFQEWTRRDPRYKLIYNVKNLPKDQ